MDRLKREIHTGIEALFAEAAINELSNDAEQYKRLIGKIAAIAEILEIQTVITKITIDVRK